VTQRLAALCDVTMVQVNGCDVITLAPKIGGSGIELIYTHGGSYIHPIVKRHWHLIQGIIQRTGATITVPLYGLAPAKRLPEAYAMLDLVFATATERAGDNPIFLAGDSAGGGLAIGQAIRRRDAGGHQPAGLILFSPWVELTMANPDISKYERVEPMLKVKDSIVAAKQWTDDPDDPLASPINDTLENLPPIAIYQGGKEIFLPDVESFAEKARAAGTNVHLWIEPKAFHVWVAVGWLPESKSALDDVAEQLTGKTKSS
jgi:acetyl esterase/lipase